MGLLPAAILNAEKTVGTRSETVVSHLMGENLNCKAVSMDDFHHVLGFLTSLGLIFCHFVLTF